MNGTIWNFGDILDAIGEKADTSSPALIHGERTIDWGAFTARTNILSRALYEHGIDVGDKVAFYARNCSEYVEGVAATFKARFVHVNINYRYRDDELLYILENSDTAAVFYDVAFRENVDRVRERAPRVKLWIEIGSEGNPPEFAVAYEALVSEGDPSPLGIERSEDDLFFVYTGGTTGMPKGVMWTHRIWREANLETIQLIHGFVPVSLTEHINFVREYGRFQRQLPACPLMHGTGLFTALGAILNGGAVVTMTRKASLDAEELWSAVAKHKVTGIAIVGDAFAKPMLKELDENPGRHNLSSVQTILSSGVMWSTEVKQGLLEHMPSVILQDAFGASEAVGFGLSIMTANGIVQTAKFRIGENCKVFSEDGRELEPGSDEPGFIARCGAVPLGYYKDSETSEKTFQTVDGVRYAVPGDWCLVAEDGTLTLLGRGSICINSAGEKIYPEEVEETLKEHQAVRDALVVGVPDEKWGEAVTAVVELSDAETADEDTLRSFVRGRLAPYKAPKQVLYVSDLGRAPNGKANYKLVKQYAMEQLGIVAPEMAAPA